MLVSASVSQLREAKRERGRRTAVSGGKPLTWAGPEVGEVAVTSEAVNIINTQLQRALDSTDISSAIYRCSHFIVI